jgi:hypothetical protein
LQSQWREIKPSAISFQENLNNLGRRKAAFGFCSGTSWYQPVRKEREARALREVEWMGYSQLFVDEGRPTRPGLVLAPEKWKWSATLDYATGELGPVFIDQGTQRVKNPLTAFALVTHPSNTAKGGAAVFTTAQRLGQPA